MNELRVLNLSTYTSPKIVENKTDNFVAYGDDNNYFQFLIYRYNGSATNNAIINMMIEILFIPCINFKLILKPFERSFFLK